MAGAPRLLLIGCLLHVALCQVVFLPQTIEVLSGSCVTIPCSFQLNGLDRTCTGIWRLHNKDGLNVFTSNSPGQTSKKQNGELTGNLLENDCTTTLNNMLPNLSGKYFFRVECQNYKWTFAGTTVNISVKDTPPRPTLTPASLTMKEGTITSLSCSAAAPCPSHPPTLTWTGIHARDGGWEGQGLDNSKGILQEKHDKTKAVTSVLTFTASHLHDGQHISCVALYNRQPVISSEASLTVNILYLPKNISVSVSPVGLVLEGSSVTLTCSSNANPAVHSYTWYRVDGAQVTSMGNGQVLLLKVSQGIKFYCEARNYYGAGNSTFYEIDIKFAAEILSSSGCIRTATQINCSCETVGKPPPTLEWRLDNIPVTHSDRITVRQEPLANTGLRSFIIINQSQRKDLSTLVCHSTNSVGSASHQFCVHCLESLQGKGQVPLPVFIGTVAALTAALVCALVFAVRAQMHHNLPKVQTTADTSAVVVRQALTGGEGNEVAHTPEEGIYMNSQVLTQAGEPNTNPRLKMPRSESHDTKGPGKSTAKMNEDSDVLYSSLIWKKKKSRR